MRTRSLAVLVVLGPGLAGCPALLSDDFVISQDGGVVNEAGLADGGSGYYDVGTTPLEADSVAPTDAPACTAPATDYYKKYPASWCATYSQGGVGAPKTTMPDPTMFVIAQNTTIVLGRDANQNCIVLAENYCSGCNYTCACLLKDRCPNGPGSAGCTCAGSSGCTCEQAEPGGIILFGPIPAQ